MAGTTETPTSRQEGFDIEKQERVQDKNFEPVRGTEETVAAGITASAAPLEHVESHASNHDMHHVVSYIEIGDEVYDRLTLTRKNCITAILSLCGFLSPISSTTVLAAVPEVASTYNTTGTIINLTNALYLIAMGFSPVFWGPMSQVYGRRWVGLLLRNNTITVLTSSNRRVSLAY